MEFKTSVVPLLFTGKSDFHTRYKRLSASIWLPELQALYPL